MPDTLSQAIPEPAIAINLGCEIIEIPKEREGDPDRKATFKDFEGNMWSVGTQTN